MDYIEGQSVAERARILAALHDIGVCGFTAARVSFKPIRGKLWEIRIQSRLSHRLFYVVVQGDEMVILHAFTKKTQKAPFREIAAAETRLREVLKKEER